MGLPRMSTERMTNPSPIQARNCCETFQLPPSPPVVRPCPRSLDGRLGDGPDADASYHALRILYSVAQTQALAHRPLPPPGGGCGGGGRIPGPLPYPSSPLRRPASIGQHQDTDGGVALVVPRGTGKLGRSWVPLWQIPSRSGAVRPCIECVTLVAVFFKSTRSPVRGPRGGSEVGRGVEGGGGGRGARTAPAPVDRFDEVAMFLSPAERACGARILPRPPPARQPMVLFVASAGSKAIPPSLSTLLLHRPRGGGEVGGSGPGEGGGACRRPRRRPRGWPRTRWPRPATASPPTASCDPLVPPYHHHPSLRMRRTHRLLRRPFAPRRRRRRPRAHAGNHSPGSSALGGFFLDKRALQLCKRSAASFPLRARVCLVFLYFTYPNPCKTFHPNIGPINSPNLHRLRPRTLCPQPGNQRPNHSSTTPWMMLSDDRSRQTRQRCPGKMLLDFQWEFAPGQF